MSVDRANPDRLELIRKSSRRIEFNIVGLTGGVTVVSARWMLKASQTAADEDALVSKQVTLSAGPTGQVEDAGAEGTARVAIQIDPEDLDDVTQAKGLSSLKVTLSDGQVAEIPAFRLPVTILPALINMA